MSDSGPITVAILALPEAAASTVFGMVDMFSSAGRDWALLTTGRPGAQRMRPLIVAPGRDGFRAVNGAYILPDASFADGPTPDVVCLPDLFLAPGEPLAGRFAETVAWLRRCDAAGATLAAACSGALLLAEAGLLDGLEATTHWAYCDALRQAYPKVRVAGARALVAAGEGQRILTAGGGTSWLDMALFLVARFFGQEEAMRLARLYLVDWHAHGQLPYATVAAGRQADDRQIAVCQEWLGDHYHEPRAVAAMVRLSGLSERSFKRRFARATGMAPLDYVHTLRLEEAKQLLETSDLPVEAVAVEIGYEDASFFRRLFRRKVGMAPLAYRKRFRGLRRVLGEAEGARAAG
jgi:transcriptional regulator GlxA family with amidase domain